MPRCQLLSVQQVPGAARKLKPAATAAAAAKKDEKRKAQQANAHTHTHARIDSV